MQFFVAHRGGAHGLSGGGCGANSPLLLLVSLATLVSLRNVQVMVDNNSIVDNRRKLCSLSLEEIVGQTKLVQDGLSSLRQDHFDILAKIRKEEEEEKEQDKRNDNLLLRERIHNVSRSLEQLEVGIEESSVILQLSDHFYRLEADRATLRLEMARVQDENDWLREELSATQAKLQHSQLDLAELQEEKRKWDFEEELRVTASESSARPVTPSKIPVGAWRVEEEKDITKAMNSPPPSKIPVGGWRSKSSVYKDVMDKESVKKAAAVRTTSKTCAERQYFKISSSVASGRSKIPSR